MPRGRRSLTDFEHWAQRIISTASKWKGWSITKNQRARVLIRRREASRPSETVSLPRPIVWEEAYESDIQDWAKQLWKTLDNDPDQTLRGALEDTAPKSDRHGEAFAVTWVQVEQSFKRTLMEEGNEIALKTYEASYLKFVSMALKELAAGRHSNGRDLLRACIAPWKDKYASRGYCINAVSKFLLHAVTEHDYPGAWLISANDKKQLRGKKQAKKDKAVLTDQQILDLIAAIKEKNSAWASVIKLITATGIRAVECQYLVVKRNPVTGEDQLYSTYSKTGGKNPTKPRFLFPLPLTGDDRSKQLWDFTSTFKTMEWPIGDDGERMAIDGKTVGARLRDHAPIWNELRAKIKEETGEWLRPYMFRDSWNVRADNLGVQIGVKCNTVGNSP